MKKIKFLTGCLSGALFLFGCGSNQQPATESATTSATSTEATSQTASGSDDAKGIGKFQNVQLTHPLDQAMVTQGKAIYEVKCGSCHKLTDEKLVGPGWKGVTDRRTPEWIMNFVNNTDEMIDKDANAQALLELCMVRMPNQHLTDDETRQVLEFMRSNDGKN